MQLTIWLITYNHEKTIRQCMDSIINQDFTDYELIITDNASTDDTIPILKQYCLEDKRIILHAYTENKAYLTRMDETVEEASGEYFVGFSGDDWITEGILQKAVTAAKRFDADIVQFGHMFRYFDENAVLCASKLRAVKDPLVLKSKEEISKNICIIIEHCHLESEQNILRKISFIRDNHIMATGVGWDLPLVAAYLYYANRYVALTDEGYNYRTYTSQKAKNKTHAVSNDIQLSLPFIETMPWTYDKYCQIANRIGQDIGDILNKYICTFYWIIEMYIPNALYCLDSCYSRQYLSPAKKIMVLELLLRDEHAKDFITIVDNTLKYFNTLMDTVQRISLTCKDSNELVELGNSSGWLMDLYLAYTRLRHDHTIPVAKRMESFILASLNNANNIYHTGAFLGNLLIEILQNAIHFGGAKNNTMPLSIKLECLQKMHKENYENQDLFHFLQRIHNNNISIAIYGAGEFGRKYFRLLSYFGITPVCFIDRKLTGQYENIDIVTLEVYKKKYTGMIILAFKYDEVKQQVYDSIHDIVTNEIHMFDGFYDLYFRLLDSIVGGDQLME